MSLRIRWLEDRYQGLRNACWMVRNSRVGAANNPLALRAVLVEAMRLIAQRESLYDVIEALCELLIHP